MYADGERKQEYLGLILSTTVKRDMNPLDKEKLKQAENIKSRRSIELNEGEVQVLSKTSRILLSDYLDSVYQEKVRSKSRSLNKFDALFKHCKRFFSSNMLLSGINKRDIEGFIDYLARTIKPNTAAPYLSMFKAIINQAYKKELIRHNPLERVQKSIQKVETHRTFLVIEDIRRLESCYCHERVKNAFLFCCYTGLRFSDVKALTWGQIQSEGGRLFMYYQQKKTDKPERVPIAKVALKYMPDRGAAEELVFNLPSLRTTLDHLAKWEQVSGIGKHITFHTARHTFATLALTVGVDIKTVSTLLGHSEVRTTEIYAKIIDKKKEAAVDMLPE
jgi:integrase